MLSERLVTAALRILNRSYLSQDSSDDLLLPPPGLDRGYVLYLHVPFCERLCLYCSFNRFIFDDRRCREYFKDLREEMRMLAGLGYSFPSLYIGGGTPTVMLDELTKTIDLARSLFDIKEVSCETSPNHLDERLVDELAGRVHRLSVGVQSFDEKLLRQMDRFEKYGDGHTLLERVSGVSGKFNSLNVDMMFNFPSQTEEILSKDIELLKATGANQTTFYPLMASPLNRLELARAVGRIDYKREAHYYRVIADKLSDQYIPTSAWTYSKDTNSMIDEYIVDYEEYVGIGSGALSFLGGTIYSNTFSLTEYSRAIRSGRMSVAKRGRPYGTKALMRYRFVTDLFGLRLDKKRFLADFGIPVERGLAPELAFMHVSGGIAKHDDEEITLTETGRYLLMVMMRETLASSNDARDKARAGLPPEDKMLLTDSSTERVLVDDAVGSSQRLSHEACQ
ncbi:MAG: coproporphyrinogen III oxidase family protein [Actinobacteria bacterium]|nr:coproporphyrinogen III oxidase family protein [Actinomycetota bacterium]MCL5888249.1 coproporphyrinogen III oxidase family protein [Actinomycetota bacterium]